MNKPTAAELLLHFAVLQQRKDSYTKLSDLYSKHLTNCVKRWYGIFIYRDISLSHEAVHQTLHHYFEHPRLFNPQHGCLQKYLEINADRIMQNILAREQVELYDLSLDHVLTKYFDNDLDIQLSKLILHNEKKMVRYVSLLDIGSFRFPQQLHEIKRYTTRIKKILDKQGTSLSLKRNFIHRRLSLPVSA